MAQASFDGFALSFSAPSSTPTIGIAYSTGRLSRSSSVESFTSVKRKRSEDSMSVTNVAVTVPNPSHPTSEPIILPDVHHNPDEPYVAPPSPVPTEIWEEDVEESCEERMEAAKATGVKVRDFAYEPISKERGDPRAPEIWNNPRESLIMHDRYIRRDPTECEDMRLSGKVLYNLLITGWVTHEEASKNWRPGDWKVVNDYICRPNGPHPVRIPKHIKKPTAAYRAALRLQSFKTLDNDVPEQDIYVPPDEPGMDDGPKRMALPLQAYATVVAPPPDIPPPSGLRRRGFPPANVALAARAANDAHVDKRRRSSGESATPPATPPAGPSRTLSQSLSRSASFESLSGSRTPPADEPRPVGRRPRALQRTQTMASIPVR